MGALLSNCLAFLHQTHLEMAASNSKDIKVFDVKGAYQHAKMDSEV